MFIKEVKASLIKNSRKESTIQVKIKTYKGNFCCSAPSGKSKGIYEVQDYNQRGIRHSVKLANIFLRKLKGKWLSLKNFQDLNEIEDSMKKFEKHYGILGGNVFYAIQGALLKAAAKERNLELWQFIHGNGKPKIPHPVGNCIGGGLHTATHFKKPDFQEFVFIGNEKTFSKSVSNNILAYYEAREKIRKREKRMSIKKNDENALISKSTNQEVLEIMRDVASQYGLKIGLDVAASSFFNKKQLYDYKHKRFYRDSEEQIEYIFNLINEFDLFYVEDPFHEEDFVSFQKLKALVDKHKKNTLIVGDDLTTTNLQRLKRAVRTDAINALIVKPNQIGSLIEVKKVVDFCKANNIKMIFSHRSGETLDNIIADYAVGFGADFIKTGILGRERLIKLRRIIDIEKKFLHKNI